MLSLRSSLVTTPILSLVCYLTVFTCFMIRLCLIVLKPNLHFDFDTISHFHNSVLSSCNEPCLCFNLGYCPASYHVLL